MTKDEIVAEEKQTGLTKTETIQLIMVGLTIILYSTFLVMQAFLPFFSQLRSKIIIVDILLAIGILIEVGHLIWIRYKEEIVTYFKKLERK
ncbi:MAG: hypothetical protein ACTSQE_09520 [Candidatus Heimdallarchaeaceae archaeon]